MTNIKINIKNSTLFRFALFQLPDVTAGVVSCLHHLIADAWSLGLMAVGIKEIYESLVSRVELPKEKHLYFVKF